MVDDVGLWKRARNVWSKGLGQDYVVSTDKKAERCNGREGEGQVDYETLSARVLRLPTLLNWGCDMRTSLCQVYHVSLEGVPQLFVCD